tara:strand:- start:99 stop:497 length:399 start_codon:yes stop_codon:yes gene_type:complete
MKKLMVVLAMFTTGMVAAQSNEEVITFINKFYEVEDWNKDGVREKVISRCKKDLIKRDLDILNPTYREVQVVFRDKKNNMSKLLNSKCGDYVLDKDDYIKYSWKSGDLNGTWELIIIEIENKGIRYSVYKYN